MTKLVFDWDANKARENVRKHRVSFEEAKTIFNDPLLVTFLDEYHSNHEERYISIGTSGKGRILLVVHTEQIQSQSGWVIRLINCRKATASEHKVYEEGKN